MNILIIILLKHNNHLNSITSSEGIVVLLRIWNKI